MKPIKLKNLLQPFALMLFVIALASCSKSAPKYARLIDKDASFVLSVNVKQIGDKSKIGEDKKAAAKMKDLLKDQGLSASTTAKLKSIIDDPAEAGVDLREPLLIFIEDISEERGGMVGALHDCDKFTSLLKTLAKEGDFSAPQKDGELNKMVIGNLMLVYNDDWFYINPEVRDEDEAFEYISERFKANDEQSIRSREDFKEMCKYDGDMQMLISGIFYEKSLGYSDLALMQKLMPSDLDMADFSMLFDLNTDDGEAELTMKALALTDKAKEYIDKNGKWIKDIDGELLKYVPQSSWLAAATNFNGEELYELVRESLKDENYLPADTKRQLKKVLTSFDGDMTVCCGEINEYTGMPKMTLLAKVKDDNILDLVKDTYGWEKTPSGSYKMEGVMTMGVKDGILYISNDDSMKGLPSISDGMSASDFKGKPFYAILSLKRLLRMPSVRDAINNDSYGYDKAVKTITNSLDKVELWLEDGTTAKMRLKLTKDVNPLTLLASLIEEFDAPIHNNDIDYDADYAYGVDTACVDTAYY